MLAAPSSSERRSGELIGDSGIPKMSLASMSCASRLDGPFENEPSAGLWNGVVMVSRSRSRQGLDLVGSTREAVTTPDSRLSGLVTVLKHG
jgi:hypothetical protein